MEEKKKMLSHRMFLGAIQILLNYINTEPLAKQCQAM